jgi:L-amino acid N-acyltransferase YncA
MLAVRFATKDDLQAILEIYNQGIEDRIATLEQDAQDVHYIENWFANHYDRYRVFVAQTDGSWYISVERQWAGTLS